MKTFIVLSWLCVLSACGGGAGVSVDADQSQGVQRSVRPLSAGQWWQPFIERWRFCNIGFSTLAKARKNDSPWVEQVKAIKGLNALIP